MTAARKREFPLFEVPYELPFIAITERAFAQLLDERYEMLQRNMAGDVLAEALTGHLYPEDLQARLRPVRDRRAGGGAGVLGCRTRARPAAPLERILARERVPSLVAIRAGLLCAVIDADGVEPDPLELGARASARELAGALRRGARRRQPRRPPTHSLRMSFHEARCALEAVRLQQRRRPARSPPTRTSAPSSCCCRCRTTTR